jgi:hypothetical protein
VYERYKEGTLFRLLSSKLIQIKNTMPGKTPQYSEMYKLAVLILIAKGEDPYDLAKCIQPTAATIRNWDQVGLTGTSRDDKDLKRVKQERNSLVKILASVLGDRQQPGSS